MNHVISNRPDGLAGLIVEPDFEYDGPWLPFLKHLGWPTNFQGILDRYTRIAKHFNLTEYYEFGEADGSMHISGELDEDHEFHTFSFSIFDAFASTPVRAVMAAHELPIEVGPDMDARRYMRTVKWAASHDITDGDWPWNPGWFVSAASMAIGGDPWMDGLRVIRRRSSNLLSSWRLRGPDQPMPPESSF